MSARAVASAKKDRTGALNFGTHFCIDLASLSRHATEYTIQQLLPALNATTTLRCLSISFGVAGEYDPTPLNNRLFVEPLCRCIANLRLQNGRHRLRTMAFYGVDEDMDYNLNSGSFNAMRLLLVAIKQFGIARVTFYSIESFPITYITDFCRDNHNLKVLDICCVSFSDDDDDATLQSLPLLNGPPSDSYSSIIPTLDQLLLTTITFNNLTAATKFANWIAQLNVRVLDLPSLVARNVVKDGNDDEYDDDYDEDSVDEYAMELTKRIVPEFKMPSVEMLTLQSCCKVEHFKAAVEAGTATLTHVKASVSGFKKDDATAKLDSLARMIWGAVRLESLTIRTLEDNRLRPPRRLLQALEACASVTEIQVNKDSNRAIFSKRDVQLLRRVTARNQELARWMASPHTYPNEQLLTLMRQFDSCPTGRFMLSRLLPELFSFQKGSSLFQTMDPNPTKKLHKKRKIS